jgi:hypothetical protein
MNGRNSWPGTIFDQEVNHDRKNRNCRNTSQPKDKVKDKINLVPEHVHIPGQPPDAGLTNLCVCRRK